MKNELTLSLTLGFIGIIWIFFLLLAKSTPTSIQTVQPTPSAQKTLSRADVKTHSSENDCWIIVDSKVYDVTSFIPNHPGGSGMIIPYCGSDATDAFNTKGGRGQHSMRAQQLLESYYVGNVQ